MHIVTVIDNGEGLTEVSSSEWLSKLKSISSSSISPASWNKKSIRPATKQVKNTKIESKGGDNRCVKRDFDIGVPTEAMLLGRWSGRKVSEDTRFIVVDGNAKCQKTL